MYITQVLLLAGFKGMFSLPSTGSSSSVSIQQNWFSRSSSARNIRYRWVLQMSYNLMDNVYRDHEIYNFGRGHFTLSEYAFVSIYLVVSVEVRKRCLQYQVFCWFFLPF